MAPIHVRFLEVFASHEPCGRVAERCCAGRRQPRALRNFFWVQHPNSWVHYPMFSWVHHPMSENSRSRLLSTSMKIRTLTEERFHLRQRNRLLLVLFFALNASLVTQTAARAGNVYVDRTLQAQLATLGPITPIQAVVNFDP